MVSTAAWFFGLRCAVCGGDGAELCRSCRWRLRPAGDVERVAPLASLAALVRYEDAGRDLVLALKYHDRRGLVAELAPALARLAPSTTALVTWVPTTPARRRQRGYDQARLLAAAVAARLGRPCVNTMRRLDRHEQTGRHRRERLIGPRVEARGPVAGTVLMVDDVITTGSTLRSGARCLLGAGAGEVHGLAVAHTPPGV